MDGREKPSPPKMMSKRVHAYSSAELSCTRTIYDTVFRFASTSPTSLRQLPHEWNAGLSLHGSHV